MKWKPLTLDTAIDSLEWRESAWQTLRTPWPLTPDEQEEWHRRLAGNHSMRYFEGFVPGKVVAVFGLTDIDLVNRKAQISLIVNPISEASGWGNECFAALKHIAFDRLNLSVLYAEVYSTNKAIGFWKKMKPSRMTKMPFAVFRNGEYHGSTFFFYEAK